MNALRSLLGPQLRWPPGYAPLRRRTLVLQLALLVGAELALFDAYRAHDSGFHWSTHLLVGLSAAAVWNLAVLLVKAAPARGQLLSILAFHLYAMVPDLLFAAGIPHQPWMNVFLGHLDVHHIPGEERSWLAIGLGSYGIYVALLTAWIAARRREVEFGMCPGIGIGGIAIVQPQHAPQTTPLAHLRFGPDQPPELLLLHGLGASATFWTPFGRQLAANGRSALAPDLLGFGRSRRIGTRFALQDQVDALVRLLEGRHTRPLEIVAHSAGCLVAVALATAHPQRVRRLVLVSPPAFADPEAARQRLAQRSLLARMTLANRSHASVACGLMCLGRGMLVRIAPRLARDLPTEVARDGLQHSWPAYRAVLTSLFDRSPLLPWLEHPQVETLVVVADQDETTPSSDILGCRDAALRIVELSGDHLLPLTMPQVLFGAMSTGSDRRRHSTHGQGPSSSA